MSARELAVLRDRIARERLKRERTDQIAAARAARQRPYVFYLAPPTVRYQTDEERLEARRRTWRESSRRRRQQRELAA